MSLQFFNFQFEFELRRINYTLFIFNGVICHVSTLIMHYELCIMN